MNNRKCTKIIVNSSKNIKNEDYSEPSELKNTAVRELRPILLACQLMGMPCYSLSKTNTLFKIGIIYSSLIIIFNIFALYTLGKSVYYEAMDKKLKILILCGFMLLLVNICADIALSTLGHVKLENLLSNTFCDKKFEKKGRNYFLPISIFVIFVITIFFLLMAALPFLFNEINIMSSVLFITANQALAFFIFQFLSIVVVFRKKFQHLNSALVEGWWK